VRVTNLLSDLQTEFTRWHALISSLSEEQLSAPIQSNGWSVQDILAHLHNWQRVSIARLEAAIEQREPVYPAWTEGQPPDAEENLDIYNERIYRASRELPAPAVVLAWKSGFLRFLELAEAIPEVDLLESGKFTWLEDYALIDVLEGSLEHHREHYDGVAPLLHL
jgi:hypothetical protein